MGPLQTYFYLAVLGGLMVVGALVLVALTAPQVLRLVRRERDPRVGLAGLLVAAGVFCFLCFFVLTIVGATISVVRGNHVP
jgi:H+/gluconate symporter-like permease